MPLRDMFRSGGLRNFVGKMWSNACTWANEKPRLPSVYKGKRGLTVGGDGGNRTRVSVPVVVAFRMFPVFLGVCRCSVVDWNVVVLWAFRGCLRVAQNCTSALDSHAPTNRHLRSGRYTNTLPSVGS